jgi:hypothetical protein
VSSTRRPAAIESSGFGTLTVTLSHPIAVAGLPARHADPFDRLLIVEAQLEHLTIVTPNTAFEDYDVRILDARVQRGPAGDHRACSASPDNVVYFAPLRGAETPRVASRN